MSALIGNVFSFDFFSSLFAPPPPDIPHKSRRHGRTLDTLNLDILVDHIVSHLDVGDILALRMSNWALYQLTQEPAIWKRLIRAYPGPLPPLPPVPRHAFGNMRALEAERLLTRAMTFHTEWSSSYPVPHHVYWTQTWYQVHGMTLLPGGHYLVASVSNKARTKWYLLLFAMDYSNNFAYPLARVGVDTKAYEVTAKYMFILEHHGIAISYIRRECTGESKWRDASDFSDKYDIKEVDFKYECTTLFVPLTTLERLVDLAPEHRPGTPEYMHHIMHLPAPFKRIATLRARSPLLQPCLNYLDGKPYASVIQQPNDIAYKHLDERKDPWVFHRCLPPPPLPSQLKCTVVAFRNLPLHNQVLVVRRVAGTEDAYHLELYPVAYDSNEDQFAIEGHAYSGTFHSVQISELHYPYFHNPARELRFLPRDRLREPPTVYVYCRATNPDMLKVWELQPEILPYHANRNRDWRAHRVYPPHCYALPDTPTHEFTYPETFGVASILPGNGRAVLWTFPRDNRSDTPALRNIWSFVPPQDVSGERAGSFAPVGIEDYLFEHFEKGVQTLAWDETIGRLVVVAPEDSRMWVFDFAKTPTRREREAIYDLEGRNTFYVL